MQPDDEIVFGRVLDESRSGLRHIQSLQDAGSSEELSLTVAEFELHGETLRRLADWYPEETHVQQAAQEWARLRLACPR